MSSVVDKVSDTVLDSAGNVTAFVSDNKNWFIGGAFLLVVIVGMTYYYNCQKSCSEDKGMLVGMIDKVIAISKPSESSNVSMNESKSDNKNNA